EIAVRSEAVDFVELVNSMSYSLRVSATLLRGLMLIYDKQWIYLGKFGIEFCPEEVIENLVNVMFEIVYLESDLDSLYTRVSFREMFWSVFHGLKQFREGGRGIDGKGASTTLVRRSGGGSSKRKNVLLREMISIDSSLSLNGDSLSDSNNTERNGDLILPLNAENIVLDLSSSGIEGIGLGGFLLNGKDGRANVGRIEDITLPGAGGGRVSRSKEFGADEDFGSPEDGEWERSGGRKSSSRGESQMVLWSSINNEEFMFQGEENDEILEGFGRERERSRLGSERRSSVQGDEAVVEVVSEAPARGDNKKRPRSLSYIDVDLRFKGISSSNRNRLEMLILDDEMIQSIDERFRGWDSYKWWQMETRKSDQSRFMLKFQTLSLRSMTKSKRIAPIDHAAGDLESYGAIEKHRGDKEDVGVDLGLDDLNISDEVLGSPSARRFRAGRDTIENSVNYYGDGLNSSDGARLQSGRESMIFSDSRRGSSAGVRLSTMLEAGSSMSYNSCSPFQLERSLLGAQREGMSSELQRVLRSGRLSGSIGSNDYAKQLRSNSIATSISDIFYLDEVKSANWSRSGVTASSGTYNLKTYTVQKFIASRMKEIREIRKINKENGYLLDHSHSNKENMDSNKALQGSEQTGEEEAARQIEDFEAEDEMSIYLDELLPQKTVTRGTAAVFFYHLLVLATYNEVRLTQNTPGGNIKITKTTSFNEES
ncbi:hypothetical protein OIY81_3727, partial [Cryptosporidium canis]